jgi:hypothetical protein
LWSFSSVLLWLFDKNTTSVVIYFEGKIISVTTLQLCANIHIIPWSNVWSFSSSMLLWLCKIGFCSYIIKMLLNSHLFISFVCLIFKQEHRLKYCKICNESSMKMLFILLSQVTLYCHKIKGYLSSSIPYSNIYYAQIS